MGTVVVVVHAALTIDARSLWLDEAYSLGAANFPGLSLSRTRGTMGLYYVILSGWSQVSVATWWLRVPSVLFAVASLVVLRRVALRVGGPRLAAVAVPFLALSSLFEWKATEARAYSLETLLICGAWLVALRAVDRVEEGRDLWWWLALVPLAVAGVFSHGLFLVHLAPVALVALCGPRPLRSAARLAPAFVASGVAALALRRAGASEYGTSVIGGPFDWTMSTLLAFLPGPPLVRLVLVAAAALGLAVTVRRALRASDPRARVAALVPAAWAVGPVLALGAISVVDPLFNPRYLSPVAPGLALLLASAVLGVEELRPGSAGLRSTGPAVRVTGAVVGLALAVSLVTTPDVIVEDWRQAAEVVADGSRPGDALLFANLSDDEPEQQRPPFEAAWAEVDHDADPTVISSDRPLGRVRRYDSPRTAAEMGRAAAGHDRIWIIDGGSGAAVGRAAILRDPAFAAFEAVRSWSVPDDIEVHLYQRTTG